MKEKIVPAQYLQIARDIASRVARGDLATGSRLYGRSVMASEYGVSPETIRRSLRLLADMKVIEVKPQSGATILSADSARRYLENFSNTEDTRLLLHQIQGILKEQEALNEQLLQTATTLVKSREIFSCAAEPLPNYEVPVPADSPIIGKSIGELKFWQSTGGTIIAIRRSHTIIISPGPYAELYPGDVMIIVGTPGAAEAARKFAAVKDISVS